MIFNFTVNKVPENCRWITLILQKLLKNDDRSVFSKLLSLRL